MTRHLLIAFAILFLSAAAAIAQTNVSGNITQNTTWTKAGSPYILTGNVGVTSTSTLTIEPGVLVQRNSGQFQITLNGALKSVGTMQDSITFLTNDEMFPVPFLLFKKSNLSNTTLRFVNFPRGGPGYRVNIQIGSGGTQTNSQNSGTLRIARSYVSGDIYNENDNAPDSILIDSCQVNASYIYNTYPQAAPIIFSNSQLLYADIASGAAPGSRLYNCQVTGGGIRLLGATSGYVVSHCSFMNSSLDGDYYTTGESYVDSSTFLNSPVAASNLFVTNSKFTATGYLYFEYNYNADSALIHFGSGDIRGCEFINNSPVGITGITLNSDQKGFYPSRILRNQFRNMYDAVVARSLVPSQLDSNDFYAPGRYAIANLTQSDFSALHDYFQLQGGQTIDDLIFDQNDDLNYGLVTYIPYAASPNIGVFPVALTRFTGSKEGNTIHLNWQTGNEANVSSFVVQRRTGNGFADIGTVAASGTGAGGSYSFTDVSPLTGTNEYRLKITEKDGKIAYSNIVPVDYGNLVQALRVYPNPASAYIVIEYAAANAGTQLQLTDAGGRIIKTMVAAAGSTQARMNVGDVAKGTYRLVVKDGSNTESRTVLIQ